MFGKRRGVEKVSFWLIMILTSLSACIGIRVGVLFPQIIEFFKRAWTSLIDSSSETTIHVFNSFKDSYVDNPVSFYISTGIALLIAGVIIYIFNMHSPKKRKSFDIDDMPFLERIQLLLYLGALAFGFSVGLTDRVTARFFSLELGLLTAFFVVGLIKVLQDVYGNPNSTDFAYFEQHKKSVLIKTTLLGVALIGFPLWIPDFWGFSLPQLLQNQDLLGYYTAILSLTFISISVMSVLSDRTVVIYWENIAEGKLIKPVFGSFAAYTYYSIGAALAAGVCVVLNNGIAFILFSTINIATIILLTYTMVDVYYDRESKRARREKELQMDEADYRWICEALEFFENMPEPSAEDVYSWDDDSQLPSWLLRLRNNPKVIEFTKSYWYRNFVAMPVKADPIEEKEPIWFYKANAFIEKTAKPLKKKPFSLTEKEPKGLTARKRQILTTYQDKEVGYKHYIEKMLLLCQNIHRANDEHDLTYLQEVHELYRKNLTLFNHPEGRRVTHVLFSECEAQNWLLIMKNLTAHIDYMINNATKDSDPFDGNVWNQDESLWAALTTSEYLRDWLKTASKNTEDAREMQEFIVLVVNRLVLLYNDMVSHYNLTEEDKCEYLKTIKGKNQKVLTLLNQAPSKDELVKVLNRSADELSESYFVARLMQILCLILENSDENARKTILSYFDEFPLPEFFAKNLKQLGFDDADIELLKKHL